MYEVLIREAGARFGLDNKALSVVQVLLAEMTNKDKGGLAGFLEPFKAAGFGPIIQSWLGGGPSAQPISNRQLEEVLGTTGGLLQTLTARLDVERDALTSALGYLLPALVGKLSIGGSVPSHYPPEVLSMAEAGQQLLAAPVVEPPSSGSFLKWLPWIILVIAIPVGIAYWNATRQHESAPASPAPTLSAPAPAAAQPEPTEPTSNTETPEQADVDEAGAAADTQNAPQTDAVQPVSGESSEAK